MDIREQNFGDPMSDQSSFSVGIMESYPQHQQLAAEWSVEEWKHLFPEDTLQTYLALFGKTDEFAGRLAETFVAVDDFAALLGLAILLDNDDLPGATETGPWLAGVYVTPSARRAGQSRRRLRASADSHATRQRSRLREHLPLHRGHAAVVRPQRLADGTN